MAMNSAFLTNAGTTAPDVITHIALVDDTGTELTGGSPAYARKAVTWTNANPARPSADLTFDVPSGATVAGWVGYDAATDGNAYGGADLTNETYAAQGTYKLLAASTGITFA